MSDILLVTASCDGNLAQVNRALDDGGDPRYVQRCGNSLEFAAYHGHLAIVNRLLEDDRVNPADHNHQAIYGAADNGQWDVVQRLLEDERTDPATHKNYVIRSAAGYYGHLPTVERLLEDNRVNPADRDNRAMMDAAENGHIETVNALADWYRARQLEIPRTPAIDNILRQRQEINNRATLVFSSGVRQGIFFNKGVRGPLQIAVGYAAASPADVVPVSNKVCQEAQRKVRQNLVPG